MNDKVIRKMLKRLRKLDFGQRILLMEWLNAWYSDMKENQRRMEDEES